MRITPSLETPRLRLRAASAADVGPLLRTMQDPDVLRYYGVAAYQSEQEAIAEIAWFNRLFDRDEGVRWVIADRESDLYLGDAGLFRYRPAHARAEIGYRLQPQHWGKGLMTEALRAVVQYGFDHLSLNRVEALVDPRNAASIRVLAKLGFAAEGILREYEIEGDQPVDLVMLSLLRREWSAGGS